MKKTRDISIEVRPLKDDNKNDYFEFFDLRADNSEGFICYCTMWNMTDEEIKSTVLKPIRENLVSAAKSVRNAAERLVYEKKLNGYLAYIDGVSVGWCNAGDKNSYEFLGRHVADSGIKTASDEKVKSIVCFEISPEHRKLGVASALLDYVCKDAKEAEYTVVEVYPHAYSLLNEDSYNHLIHIYQQAGFIYMYRGEMCAILQKRL